MAAMIALIMLAASALMDDPAPQRRIEQAPQPVRAFVERRTGCDHLAGEEPYNNKRARELAHMARALRCTAIARDERVLRRSYSRWPDVLTLLAATKGAPD